MEFDKELLSEFVTEAKEHLETIEDDFLTLEKQKHSPDSELVNKVFRAIHSIKGSAMFLELTTLGSLTHVMENIISRIRTGDFLPETKFVDALLEGVDYISRMLVDIEQSNDVDITTIHTRLSDFNSNFGNW